MLTTSSVLAVFYLTKFKRWHKIPKPSWIWVVVICGIYINDILYFTAFKMAPPAHIDLINYLWPILTICLTSLLPGEHFSQRHFIGAALGLLGVYLLLYHELGSFQISYLPGYLVAFSAALVWSVYMLATRYVGEIPVEMIIIAAFFGTFCSWGIHSQLETFVPLTTLQWFLVISMGVGAHLVAYFCWQHGINRGNYRLLSVLAYFTAVLSVGILVIAGYAAPTKELYTAVILVVIGSLVANIDRIMPQKSLLARGDLV